MALSATSAHLKISTTGRPENRTPLALDAMRGGMRVLSRLSPSGAAAVAERFFLTPRRRPRPAVERDALSRATPLVLPSEHGDLAAWQWDPAEQPRDLVEPWRSPSNGRPRVLLVHGWEGRGSQLAAFVEPLTMAGFRVVTFDAPAHGDSPGARSSFFHFAHAIACAAERFGPFEARAWPDGKLVKTNGLGHQRILRDPTTVQTVVRFVSEGLALSENESA
jgi:hypothetical protein